MVLVIVLGCLLCCSNQWSEAGEGLGNLQELMLERKKEQRHMTIYHSSSVTIIRCYGNPYLHKVLPGKLRIIPKLMNIFKR